MDSYAKGLLLAAALLVAVTLSATLAPKPAEPEMDTPAVVRRVFSVTPAAYRTQTEQTDPTETQPRFAVSLQAEPGREITLQDPNGRTLQTATADARGYAVFTDLPSGQYRVVAESSEGSFFLWDNAAVEALGGTLWSDGELLHLTDEPTVHLRLSLPMEEGSNGRVVTVTLQSADGTAFDRSFVAGTAARYAVEYGCLTAGAYTVLRGGTPLQTVVVSDEPYQQIDIDPD